jgi:hypothetical protein
MKRTLYVLILVVVSDVDIDGIVDHHAFELIIYFLKTRTSNHFFQQMKISNLDIKERIWGKNLHQVHL